jgi:hypothetical protein
LYHAKRLIQEIHKNFAEYKANFDLDDCDRILRVVSLGSEIDAGSIITLFKNEGYLAEVLPGDESFISFSALYKQGNSAGIF